jgi:hypothetical protein
MRLSVGRCGLAYLAGSPMIVAFFRAVRPWCDPVSGVDYPLMTEL